GPVGREPDPADGQGEGDGHGGEDEVHDLEAGRADVLAGQDEDPAHPDVERPRRRGDEDPGLGPGHPAASMAARAASTEADEAAVMGRRRSGVGMRPWAWRTPLMTAGLGSAKRLRATGRSASARARPSSSLPASPHSIMSTTRSVRTLAEAASVP